MRRLIPILALLFASCVQPPAPAPVVADPESLRALPGGRILGERDEHGAFAYRGLPYAEAPVGELRWRAPQPASGWADTREALRSGSACIQFGSRLGGLDLPRGRSEGARIASSSTCMRPLRARACPVRFSSGSMAVATSLVTLATTMAGISLRRRMWSW